MKRRRWWATLTAALLLGGVPAAGTAQAAPAATATLSIKATPKPVLAHEVVTVAGHLTPARVGRAVRLQRLTGTTWVTIGVAHTNAHSDYSVRTRAPLTGHVVLRALLVASDNTQVLSGQLTVAPVRPAIRVDGVSWVRTGGIVHASGGFSPARPGRRVSLQRRAGKGWATLATARLDAHGKYRMNAPITAPPGAVSLRVLASSFNGAPAVASPVHLTVVADAPPTLLGPFDAVYLGLRPGSTPGSYTPAAGGAALSFTDGGTVTSAVPADGPQLGQAALPGSARTGVYAAHDGVVDIAWETDGSTVTLRPNSDGQLTWNGVAYGVVDPLQAGHLSGVFRKAAGGSGATVSFKGSGRFDDDGITADTLLPGSDNPSGTGSYSISGNTLTMVYDAGPVESLSVYALPQFLGNEAQVVLGGATFARLP